MFTWAGMIFMARRVSPGSPMVSPQMEREGSDQLGRRRLLLPPFWKSCEILWLHICKLVLKLNAYRFTLVQKHPCKLEAIEKALAKRNAGKGLILLDASILPVRLPDIIAYQVLHNVEQGFLRLSF